MQAKDLVDLAPDELRVRERELREELLRLRLRRGTGQNDNPMKMRHTRKNLARVLTVLQQKKKGNPE
jgi:large subunit ribosomal protein L29